jgi:aminocarboxymuconate-semialdehyde decarboxylase
MSQHYERYGLTAARSHRPADERKRVPGRMIDFHAHAWIEKVVPVAKRHLDPDKTNFVRSSTEETQALNKQQENDRRMNLTDVSVRLRDMDAMGVDTQILLPSPSQSYYSVDPSVGPELTAIVNDGLVDMAKQAPDRFIPFGALPMQNPEASVTELARAVREKGIRGFQVLTNINGKEISSPEYEEVWRKAAELDVPILVHPLGFSQPDRLTKYYFNNVIGQPLETTIMLHHMIFDGVLERHPRLKLIAVHGGGYAGSYAGRMDHAWGARPDARRGIPKPPTTYLKQVYVDTVVFAPDQLKNLVEFFGPDHVLMGTDYPYDMGEYDPIGHVVDSLNDVDAVRKICGGNAMSMLGLTSR